MTNQDELQAAAEGSPAEPKRESIAGVLGVAIGLILLLACGFTLFSGRTGSVDGAEKLSAYFEGEVPFGLELEEAAKLPGGEIVVRLETVGAEEVDGSGSLEEHDEIVFVEYPSMKGIGRLFQSGRRNDDDDDGPNTEASASKLKWDKDPSFGFAATMKVDKIAWDRWQADYSVVRAYMKGGGWQESIRVNLGQEKRPLAMFVRWPRETEHSLEHLEDILRRIHMLPMEEES